MTTLCVERPHRCPWKGRPGIPGERDAVPYPNPFAPDPICCPCCGRVVVRDSKMLQMYVIPHGGIKCPDCDIVVVAGPGYFL